MKLLKKTGLTGLRNVAACMALVAACVLPAQAMASANVVATQVGVAVTTATSANMADAPKGILASGQIHKRTTPAISLANTPELPFFFKSWVFALLTVFIVVAIKRPWNTSTAKSSERRSHRSHRSAGLIAPLVRS